MNTETLSVILDRLQVVEDTIAMLEKKFVATGIDTQFYVKANPNIPPAVGMKIIYDAKGLVTGHEELQASDIPRLPIDKIENLQDVLNSKASLNDIKREVKLIKEQLTAGVIAFTGTKVNVDHNGNIVSLTNLIQDDIPELPMEKITDLRETIDFLKQSIQEHYETETQKEESDPIVNPGTYPKVSYDEKGRVIQGHELTLDDIPTPIIQRLDEVEKKLISIQKVVNHPVLIQLMNQSNETKKTTEPGTYYKVEVDEEGRVLSGTTSLEKKDLPTLSVDDINGLKQRLYDKIDRSEFNDVMTLVSTITENLNQIGDVIQLKQLVISQSSMIDQMKSQITSLTTKVDTLTANQKSFDSLYQVIDELSRSVEEVRNDVNQYILDKKNSENDNQ